MKIYIVYIIKIETDVDNWTEYNYDTDGNDYEIEHSDESVIANLSVLYCGTVEIDANITRQTANKTNKTCENCDGVETEVWEDGFLVDKY